MLRVNRADYELECKAPVDGTAFGKWEVEKVGLLAADRDDSLGELRLARARYAIEKDVAGARGGKHARDDAEVLRVHTERVEGKRRWATGLRVGRVEGNGRRTEKASRDWIGERAAYNVVTVGEQESQRKQGRSLSENAIDLEDGEARATGYEGRALGQRERLA